MNTLIVLVAAFACTVAEPQFLFKNELPFVHDYRSIVNPVGWPLRTDIPVVPSVPYFTGFKTQYDERDFLGQARYGHIEPGQSHHAVQDAFGNKIGGFSYYDSEGKLKQTSYIADSAGYRVSTNDGLIDKLVVPLPVVEDTPEVKAAKIAHLKEIEKIKLRSKRDIIITPERTIVPSVIPTIPIEYKFLTPAALPTTDVKPILKKDGFLEETPEVKFAKEHHLLGVEAAKVRNSLKPLTYPYIGYTPYDYGYRFGSPLVHY